MKKVCPIAEGPGHSLRGTSQNLASGKKKWKKEGGHRKKQVCPTRTRPNRTARCFIQQDLGVLPSPVKRRQTVGGRTGTCDSSIGKEQKHQHPPTWALQVKKKNQVEPRPRKGNIWERGTKVREAPARSCSRNTDSNEKRRPSKAKTILLSLRERAPGGCLKTKLRGSSLETRALEKSAREGRCSYIDLGGVNDTGRRRKAAQTTTRGKGTTRRWDQYGMIKKTSRRVLMKD